MGLNTDNIESNNLGSGVTMSTHSQDGQDSDYDSADDQARLLQLLNAQCAASLGGAIASTSRLEDVSDDEDSQDGHDSGDQSDGDEDDEWTGFSGDAGSSSSLANSKQPVVVSFEDSVRNGKRKLDESELATFGEKDNFMSTKIRRVNVDSANEPSRRKGKAKADEDSEEKHLKDLDASLYSLLQDLPSNATAQSNSLLLDKLSALPSPRLTTKKSQENEKVIDKHAPRTLHEKIYTARLNRAKIADAEARANGVVIAAGKGKYALTKKARREQTGAEDARRKNARGISGVVGKMRKGGAVLTLNKEEIRKGNEGDFGGINKRKSKGVPKQHRR